MGNVRIGWIRNITREATWVDAELKLQHLVENYFFKPFDTAFVDFRTAFHSILK